MGRANFKVILSLILLLIPLLYLSASTQAAVCSTVSTNSRATGLVTTPSAGGKFGISSSGACVIDIKAAFVPYKIPTYEDLKSLYYTQSKANKTSVTPPSGTTANQETLRSALNNYDVVLINGDLEIKGAVGGSVKTAVVLIDGKLSIEQDFTFGDNNTGVVFVVGGDVFIDETVTQIDAVIISSGTIYTASQPPGTCSNSSVSFEDAAQTIMIKQLVINGSLISLNPSNPIQFCRSLGDNITPAEQINHQIKYLVILRNILSDTLQRWSEIP